MDKPTWASDHSLEVCGQYYQGFVDDYKSVLSQHCTALHGHCDNVWCEKIKNMCFPSEKENVPEAKTTVQA